MQHRRFHESFNLLSRICPHVPFHCRVLGVVKGCIIDSFAVALDLRCVRCGTFARSSRREPSNITERANALRLGKARVVLFNPSEDSYLRCQCSSIFSITFSETISVMEIPNSSSSLARADSDGLNPRTRIASQPP
jgi:hypothetical protein